MDDFKLSIFIILFPRPWCFYEEFNKLGDDFEQQQKLIINSSETQLIASLADGRKEIVDVQGLLDFRSTIAVVGLDLLEDQKEVAIIKGLNLLTRCPEVEPPSCTAEQQSAQLNSIEELYERLVEGKELLSDVISFPTVLHAIQLCDGSIAYVLADHLDQVEGPYNPLSTIDIPSADAVFAVLTRVNGPNQLFALELDYEANGNIEKATWKTTYHTPKYYRYRYDPLNRITSANYGDVNATSVNPGIAQDLFSVQNITYDAIGNILSLSRFGTTGCDDQGQMENGLIDKLTYRYPEIDETLPPTDPSQPTQFPGSISQLMSIQDGAELNGLAVQGFNAGTASEDAIYRYDGAGRMTNDPYKGLTITYNHLDLPEKIATPTGDISILYDATGRKWLQKTANETRMYVGGMEFVKDGGKFILESANTGDGRLVVAMNPAQSSADGSPQNEKSSSGNIYAEYHHKDHLGNVRVAFTDRNDDHFVTLLGTANDIEITQQLDYYPFGLQQQGQGLFHTQQEPGNRYRFNGIEHEESVGLDLAMFRAYDPAIGRWNRPDPLASIAPGWTPYRFGFNNPVRYSDALGLFENGGDDPDTREIQYDDDGNPIGVKLGYYNSSGTTVDIFIVNDRPRSGLSTSAIKKNILPNVERIFGASGIIGNFNFNVINEEQMKSIPNGLTHRDRTLFLALTNNRYRTIGASSIHNNNGRLSTWFEEAIASGIDVRDVTLQAGQAWKYKLSYIVAHEFAHQLDAFALMAINGNLDDRGSEGHYNSTVNLLSKGQMTFKSVSKNFMSR